MDNDAVLLHHTQSGPSSMPLPPPPPPRQHDLLAYLERLQHFLATAPTRWPAQGNVPPSQHHHALNRFLLPTGEYVTCVLWNGTYYITGTDIVRALVFRFEAFGRPVRNMKKFEEGIFSDLRNLKPGQDACLEEPKSQFLDLLFKFQCIRTQKKQKVFYWFSVPHDRLFIDALERDLKREKMGHESTTHIVAEPALSFSYDPKRPLFEQFNIKTSAATSKSASSPITLPELRYYNANPAPRPFQTSNPNQVVPEPAPLASSSRPARSSGFFNMFSFLEGTPTYKQRRKKTKRTPGLSVSPCLDNDLERTYGRRSLDASLAAPGPAIGRRSFEISQGRRSYDSPSSARRSLDSPSQYLGGAGQFRGITPIIVPTISHSLQPAVHPDYIQAQDMYDAGNMDVDGQQHAVRDIPQFTHVLTTPDEEQGYDGADCEYEEEKAYPDGAPQTAPLAPSAKWGEDAVSPPNRHSYMSITPFAYNSTPSTSVSSSSPAMSLSHIQTQMSVENNSGSAPFSFPPPSPLPHPLSAPSHKLTFDIPALPSGSPEDRPRSADSRPGHARRPSTASAVPSATAPSSQSFGHSNSWRYQPYPIRRMPTESGHSSPSVSARGGSPFAVRVPDSPQEKCVPPSTASSMDYTNGSEYAGYPVQASAEYGDYASSVSSASESYTHNSVGTNSPSVPFVHMLRLESGSPNTMENMELSYPPPSTAQSAYEQQQPQYSAENYKSTQQGSTAYDPSQRGDEAYDASHRGGEGFIAPQPTYPQYAGYGAPAQNTHYLVPQAQYYEQPVA